MRSKNEGFKGLMEQELTVLLAYLLGLAALITFPYFLTRRTPPGYIIGGDTLVHAAISRGILLGRNPFLDQTYNVPPNWYPFLYHLIVAGTSKVLGFSIEESMIFLQVVFTISMLLVVFYVAKELWGGLAGIGAMALSFLLLTAHRYPNPKELAPLLGLISFFLFARSRFWLSGLAMGFAFWTHFGFVLPIAGLPLVMFMIKRDKRYLIPLLVSFLVFLPFVINAALHAQNPPRIEDIYRFWETDTPEKKLLSLMPSLYLLPFVGVGLLKWARRRDPYADELLILIVLIWLARLSPILLKPFGIELWSSRFTGLLPYSYILLSAYGISGVDVSSIKVKAVVLGTLLIVLPLAGALNFWDSVNGDGFVKVSEMDFDHYYPPEHFPEIASWIIQNTGRDDVVATSEEAGMMLNAMTGRPIIATLYGHGNVFLNNEKRRHDLRTLFAGNCKEKESVIRRYRVKYIVVDPFVLQKWGRTNMSCVAHPVYTVGDVVVMEVR
ncbi:ArnT family glycosyltransferase [Thermococcus celer]|nr:transporter [Thermococcus celer]